jgi:hypothetical protein
VDKQRAISPIAGGIFLICLGVLLVTRWWWPGIMFAIGISSCAELIYRGQVAKGIGSLIFFCAIPFVIGIILALGVSWFIIGPVILIGIGVIVLVRGIFSRGE